MPFRADNYHLALGANEAAADLNDPSAGGVTLGISATLVSQRMNITGKERLSLYVRTSGTGVATINMNGTPLKADHPEAANAPIAPLQNPVIATGISAEAAGRWFTIDTSGLAASGASMAPQIQIEFVETGAAAVLVIEDAWLVAQ